MIDEYLYIVIKRKKMIETTLQKKRGNMKVTTFTNQHVFSSELLWVDVYVYLHWGFSEHKKKYKSNYNTKYKYEHESLKLQMHDQTTKDINKKVNVQLFCTNFLLKNGIIFLCKFVFVHIFRIGNYLSTLMHNVETLTYFSQKIFYN